MIRKNFTLSNESSDIIRAEACYREDTKRAPAIIICHGFKGFKDWAFFPFLAETLASAGYYVVTFNFSHNGIGSDLMNFSELDKFEKNTYSLELSDLGTIVNAIVTGKIGKGMVDTDMIGLVGHSRGGAVAILYAQKDPHIKILVTWSAIATVQRYSAEQLSEWHKRGYIEIENKRTKQIMRIGIDLLNDINNNKDKLDILSAASNLDIPTLIIHGGSDESVPVQEAQMIYDHLKTTSKELMIIEGGTHTFGASHPMESKPETLETVFYLTENWFDRYLR